MKLKYQHICISVNIVNQLPKNMKKTQPVPFYNLDVIISVDNRVR